MEKYNQVKKLEDVAFRRLTGVKKTTFKVMIEILKKAEESRRKRGGPKPKLSMEDRLLMVLEYLREYRTYFHIAVNYGLSESQVQRTHRWIEKTLIEDKRFHLPGRKKLLESGNDMEVILIDAAETAIERPKKNGI